MSELNRFLPGHYVCINQSGCTVKPYWTFDTSFQIRYKTDAEYEDHFRALFREAVSCRLEAKRPIWAQLSGGLDSSSIVCVADDLCRSGQGPSLPLETLSFVYEFSPECDERSFIQVVEQQRGRSGRHIAADSGPMLDPNIESSVFAIPHPLQSASGLIRDLRQAMRQNDARVLLSGLGGDELLGNIIGATAIQADLLRTANFISFFQSLGPWSLATKKPRLHLVAQAGRALIPSRIQALFPNDTAVGTLIDPAFWERMEFGRRLMGTQDPYGFHLPSQRARAAGLLSVIRSVSQHAFRSLGCGEVWYPFLHRPLVEFLLAIPPDQLARPGERRSLQRRSLRGILPSKILNRRSKRNPGAALQRSIVKQWSCILASIKNARVCARGYISASALQNTANAARFGVVPASLLEEVLCLEWWLRAREAGGVIA